MRERSPTTILSRVVFPEPFSPMTPMISTLLDVERRSPENLGALKSLVDIVDV